MKVNLKRAVYLDLQNNTIKQFADGYVQPMLSAGGAVGAYFDAQGYTRIGTAEIEVTVDGEAEIVANQLAALQKELAAVLAENQRRENAIRDRISKLTAITYTQSS